MLQITTAFIDHGLPLIHVKTLHEMQAVLLACLQIAEPRRLANAVLTAMFLAIQVCGAVTVSFVWEFL